MKRILAIMLVLFTLSLSGCGALDKSVTLEESNGYAKITLDNFEGEKKIKINNNAGEGSLYYKTDITSGSATLSYTEGWPWPESKLCTAYLAHNTNGGVYLTGGDSVTIIVTAKEATSGEILLICSQSPSPFE